jgi:alkylation response protein AidB-like acyl-CoA dehydrogenase
MGLGPLANALVQMELGESYLGALSMNTQGPDDATMLTLLEHGTPFQKEKFLEPLLNGEKRICYSMTEKAAGADATGMQTRAGIWRTSQSTGGTKSTLIDIKPRPPQSCPDHHSGPKP